MESLIISGFKRVNEAVAPEKLQPDELVTLQNMVLDKNTFRPYKRGGFTRLNTNSVDSSGDVVSLHDVVDEAGTNYLLASITTKLRKSSAGTGAFTDVKTGLTTGLKTRIASYAGKIYITNGTDGIFVIGDADFASNWNLEIAAPNVDGVTSALDGVSINSLDASSRYHYIIVYATEEGMISPPSKPFTHFRSATGTGYQSTSATDKNLYFGNVPVSSDSRVTKRYIFRTKGFDAGSGALELFNFYFLKVIDNTDTSFYDGDPDTDLDESFSITYLNVPTKGKDLAIHKDRLFIGNVTLYEKNFLMPAHTKIESSPPPGYTAGVQFGSGSTQSATATTGPYDKEDYNYGVTFIDENGFESEMITTPSVVTMSGGSAYPDKVDNTLQPIPFAGQDVYVRPIIKRKLYRTKRGATSTYYYLADLDTDDYSYVDSVDDSGLGAVYVAPTTKDFKSYVVYSELGHPSSIAAGNLIPVFPDDGDSIIKIFDDINGLIVFKEHSICKIYTDGSPVNWRVVKLVHNYGCSDINGICKNGNQYFFIYNLQAFLYSEGMAEPEKISELYKTSFAQISTIQGVVYDVFNQWYVMGIYTVTMANRLYIFDMKLKTWFTFTITDVKSVAVKKFGSNAGKLLFGDGIYVVYYSPGLIVDNESGSNTQYSASLKTKDFMFPDGITLGRLRNFLMNYVKTSGQDVAYVLTDSESALTKGATISTGSGSLVHDVSTDALTGSLKIFNMLSLTLSGNGLVELTSARIEYRPIRRGKAVAP